MLRKFKDFYGHKREINKVKEDKQKFVVISLFESN